MSTTTLPFPNTPPRSGWAFQGAWTAPDQATIELALANIDIVCVRVEQFRPEAAFDTIVSRAFADTAAFAKSASRLLANDGVMIAMKGTYPEDELGRLPATVRVREVVKLEVPGLKAQRHAVLMTKA